MNSQPISGRYTRLSFNILFFLLTIFSNCYISTFAQDIDAVVLNADSLSKIFKNKGAFLIDGPDTVLLNSETDIEFLYEQELFFSFLKSNLRYPKTAVNDKISGRAVVEFSLDTSGIVRDVFILEGIRFDIDSNIVDCFKNMPRWTPTYFDGKRVNLKYILPVNCRL